MKQKEIYPFASEEQKEIESLISENENTDIVKKKLIPDEQLIDLKTSLIRLMETQKPFLEADINKPSWKRSYSIDSTTSGNEVQIMYSALEPKLNVRSIEIRKTNNVPTRIKIITEKQNAYYHALQTMEYSPSKEYIISGGQKVILADTTSYLIHSVFILH